MKHKYKMHKGDVEIELQPTSLEKRSWSVYIDSKMIYLALIVSKKVNKILRLIRRSYVHLDTITVKHVISKATHAIRQRAMVSCL